MGGMNIQMHYGVFQSYLCLSLRSSNSGWHGNWFYIRENAAAPWGVNAFPSPDALTIGAEAATAY
jgi:hypothetical protein